MIRSCLFSLAAAGLAMSAPLVTIVSSPSEEAQAQETGIPSPSPSPTPNDPTADCFAVYPFGKVSIEINEPLAGTSVSPGDVLTITGQLHNPTHASLPAGRVLVRVLRDDPALAEQQWHPVVAEFTIDNVSLPGATEVSAGEQSFSSSWHVPAFAPPGSYRIELSYLAGDGSPIAGVPYVPNVFGATAAFTVTDGGSSAAVAFDRAGVLFNKAPFVFRAVPPRPDPGPLTIVAPLQAGGAHAISVNVEKNLYAWTDVEGDTLISTETEPFLVAPGKDVPVSFTWDAPTPGVYELVLRAQPLDPQILPSIVHVRFYYEGTVPRLLHVGARGEKDGSATAMACFFNSTFGPEGGSGTLRIESENTVVQEVGLANLVEKRIAQVNIPRSLVDAGFILIAEARDSEGKITDTERVEFPSPRSTGEQTPRLGTVVTRGYIVGGIVVLILLFIGSVGYRWRKHRISSNTL